MNAARQQHVLNLPEWELPRLEDLEWPLVERLTAAVRIRRLRRESLEDALYNVLHSSLAELAESAVNETIEYWLKGLGDGNNGRWPELCVELPYLKHGEITDPLTLTYCVDNGDGTRSALNRMPLDAAVSRLLEDTDLPASFAGRAKVVAFALRQLAERLESYSDRDLT